MLIDNTPKIGNGNLFPNIAPDRSILSVISFLETSFDVFSNKVKGETNANEKSLTDKLCKFLNRNADGYPFFFQHENVEVVESGSSPQVDIGTVSRSIPLLVGDKSYGEFDSFFSIEAKRLPTPGSGRKQEYVIGSEWASGGIERFKKGIHGKSQNNAAIVAYIQKEDAAYWLNEINQWISNLIINGDGTWSSDDQLKQEMLTGNLTRLISNNQRIINNNDYIKLHHYWLDIK